MKRLLPFLLLAGTPAGADPLDPPVAAADIHIRVEVNGTCAEVDAGLKGRPPLLRLRDVCHGWSSQSCYNMLLIRTQGVIQDSASVLFLHGNRHLDVAARIDREIGRLWPGYELLHLDLTRIDCEEGLAIAFDGSRVPRRGGRGYGIKGKVSVISPTKFSVRVVPDE